ncbi:TRAP transporter small permease [Eubacteriales bacterium OttesenSCG-928-A19]|nr:TRAP transporter small permease [Eubacteriales bacterium OttesenSCG-928-A19]
MASFLRTLNRWTHRVILLVAEVALIAMVIIVTLAVVLRYVFNTGLGWAEEVPRLLVTLFAFLAMAMGVRDHAHIGVNLLYNAFPKDGRMRKFLENFDDVAVLLCGLFMLYFGGRRCIQMFSLPGKLPMTGLNTWVQYLPIPIAGFVISFDSILFLTGVLKRDDLLYSEPEIDYVEEVRQQEEMRKEADD